jgi:hypothetical protein
MHKKSIEDLYWRVRRSGSPTDIEHLERSLATLDPIADFDATPPAPMGNPKIFFDASAKTRPGSE